MSSPPWFTHSSSAGSTRSTYLPPHLRTQPKITVTIPPPPYPKPAGPFDISEKFDELEVTEEEEEEEALEENIIKTKKVGPGPEVEASGVDIPPAVTSFDEMGFATKALGDNVRRCKYVNPTPIQRYAIPVAMAGRDLMACAQTGSGKTAAFCFPIINSILLHKNNNTITGIGSRGSSATAFPMALILAPTRELASQIHEEAKKFSYQTGVKVVVAYGGAPIVLQLQNLEKGVDILVATPGRLVDLIERRRVSLRNVKYLALDEADRMLDMGFERQIRMIVQQMHMPPPGSRQTMLFSATFPDQIQRLASDFLSNFIFLAAGKVGSSTDLIVQKVEFVADMDKRDYLVNLLRSQRTNNTTPQNNALTLVFVETKRGADSLERWLCSKGFPSTAIHGDKIQMERERALKLFRSGRTPILVATDVAARGLDIPHVAHVINYDLPRAVDDYVHRIGRTGRAGKSGLATAFFSDKNAPLAKPLAQLMHQANQEVPLWLDQYANNNNSNTSSQSHYGKYAAPDYSYNDNYALPDSSYVDPTYASSYAPYDVAPYDAPAAYYGYNYDGPITATGWD
ncbi:hypothetical protein ABFX02_10G111000 [Erythranthe guttata]